MDSETEDSASSAKTLKVAVDNIISEDISLRKELAELKAKLKEARDEVEVLRAEKRECTAGDNSSSEAWIPSPAQIPDIETIVGTWKKHNEIKLVLRPMLERFITDFQLTENRYNKLNALATSTGDFRYRKSASDIFRKLEVMITDLKNLLDKVRSGKEGYSLCSVDHKTVWESAVSGKYSSVQVTPEQLYSYNINESSLADMKTQNAILKVQLAKVLDVCSKQEGLLEDAAVMTNQMNNLLQDYGHATPELTDKYDEFVSKYTGNMSLVDLAEVDSSPPTNRVEQIGTPEHIQKCDLEEFYIQMVKKLRETSAKLSQEELKKQLEVALSNIDLRGCQSVSPTDPFAQYYECSEDSFEMDHVELMETEEEPVFERRITFSELYGEKKPDINILNNQMREETTAKATTAPQLDDVDGVIAPPVITGVGSLTRDAADAKIVLAKNSEEKFTKEDELIENNAPVASGSRGRTEPAVFKMQPNMTEIKKKGPDATSCNFNGAMTSTATAEARERPAFSSMQQPHIPKPENLPSTLVGPGPSTSMDCLPAPSAQSVKRNIGTSPRLLAKKGAVKYHPKPTTYSAGRVGPASSGSKEPRYRLRNREPRYALRSKVSRKLNFQK